MPDPIPSSVPIELVPMDFNFEACIKGAPLIQSRTFTLKMTGTGRVVVKKFRLTGRDAGRFSLTDPGEVTLTNGQTATFSVTFDPEVVGQHEAKVVFSIVYRRDNDRILSVFGRLPLVGLGKDCEAEQPGQPPPPDGEDENAGEGDGPEDAPPPATTPPPGGGGQPGTDPPGGFIGDPTVVCLRFWKLPGTAAGLDAAAFDGWISEVNRIYGGSGVQFRRGEGEIEECATVGAKSDPCCFDIYVGGPELFDDNRAGECEGSRSLKANQAARDEGVHEDFRNKDASLGSTISMESGNQAGSTPPAKTLAHELGHAMGLGPTSGSDHLDPDDGQPITNEDRLMHPRSNGTKLTDKERRMAARTAKLLKGAPGVATCRKSTEYRFEPDPMPRSMRFGAIEFRNAGDRIAVTGRSELGFALGTPMKLSLQVIADDEAGALDARINYARGEEGWLIAAPPPLADETPALRAPELVVELGAPIEPEFARGVRMELPRDHFGLSHRTVRLRFSASIGDSTVQHYPRNGYVTLDLTPALFTIALSQASRERRVKRGGTLRLKGQGWQSTTFTGQAGLMLWLRRHAVSRFIALEALPTPIPKRWAVEANLPDDLEPGKYRLYLLASCRRCGVDTSASGTLTIV